MKIALRFFYAFLFLNYILQIAACAPLDELALQFGTDKSSQGHAYTRLYEEYFSTYKNASIKFLEIGLLYGSSARMWEEYFSPASQLFFIDNNAQFIAQTEKILSARSHCFLVNQESSQDLQNFILQAGSDFDIIIDDGGHTMPQQITSFKTLFYHVKKGGMYVIEDLHTSWWAKFGGEGSIEKPSAGATSTLFFLLELVKELNYIGGRTGWATLAKCPQAVYEQLSYFQKHIKAIHFYNSICFILKH